MLASGLFLGLSPIFQQYATEPVSGIAAMLFTTLGFEALFVPPASGDATNLLWWLVVADDAEALEGSWGTDSFGSERQSPAPGGASGVCGFDDKYLSNACGQ